MGLTYVGPFTTMPVSAAEARLRVLLLYADWIRLLPRIVQMYKLDIPVQSCRQTVRSWFEANRQLTDPAVIHHLTVKSSMLLLEVHNRWAQRPHIVKLFGAPHGYAEPGQLLRNRHPELSPFMTDFLSKK
jgi:hypothetical protein